MLIPLPSRLSKLTTPQSLFLSLIIITYTVLFFITAQLKGPPWGDEWRFYINSQEFSQQLIPTLDQLKNYKELNTPLPFIIYGQFQTLFKGELFPGRLLNFFLSIAIAFLIGWPGKNNQRFLPVLALFGFFLYPYFLWFSTRYYTDIIAAFFGLLGVILYLQRRHLLSGLAFVLAIASRQYLVVFPMAVACHELVVAIQEKRRPSLSFFLPATATLSIIGWVLLFGGLAPSTAINSSRTPAVQMSLWALSPNSALYSLACIGLYYVLVEWVLFNRSLNWSAIWSRKKIAIAAVLLATCIAFPPFELGKGVLWQISELPLIHWLQPVLFYGLLLITCWRFSQLDLSFWLVLCHTLIMAKAYPWDKYALPILMILWLLRAKVDILQAGRD